MKTEDERAAMSSGHGKLVLYQSEDGQAKIDVHLQDETVWLTLKQLADLFDRDKSVISRHLRNIFQTGELVREAVVAKNATTAPDGKTYQVNWYNLYLVSGLISLSFFPVKLFLNFLQPASENFILNQLLPQTSAPLAQA